MKTLLALTLGLLSAAAVLAADLPPHTRAVAGMPGMIECARGYVMRANQCVSEQELAETKVVVSDLPSAGEGAPGTCPSGGCRTAAPAYSAPRVIETYTRHGDEGSIGRSPSGYVTHSVTVIR